MKHVLYVLLKPALFKEIDSLLILYVLSTNVHALFVSSFDRSCDLAFLVSDLFMVPLPMYFLTNKSMLQRVPWEQTIFHSVFMCIILFKLKNCP